MSKHTPGPWDVLTGRKTLYHIETAYNNPEPGKAICSVPHTPQGLANACLISAAPELLEYAKMEGEIEELREEIHRDEKRPHNHNEILEKYQRLDDMVDAAQTLRLSAIRKAEED